jgi:alkylhydroperoxidase family enzyme
LRRRYGDRVEFLAVYVREAHPTDGWRIAFNDQAGIKIQQPRERTERIAVAEKCCSTLEISMPLLVDEQDDRVGHAYSGMPDRLYVIDREGRVAYKGGRGPFGFLPGEMEQTLIMLLLDETKPVEQRQKRVGLLSNEAAWKRLPTAVQGAGQPLPAWARALAASMPRTTAAMLELDYLHRARSPFDGKLRWVAAHAHGCSYSEAWAAADLRRTGVEPVEIAQLAGDLQDLPPRERAALLFARKLVRSADRITDAEVAELVHAYGDKQVVAMVMLLAYANFLDRLLLVLDLPFEVGEPLEPLEVHFRRPDLGTSRAGPPRAAPSEASSSTRLPIETDTEWPARDFTQLRQALENQRNRKPRIPLPLGLPLEVRWGQVCRLYQPELAAAWTACSSALEQEADPDPVQAAHVFWVLTHVQDCFY